MWCMASVSLDQEVIFIGKNDNIIFIIHSNAGGHGGGQQRREILSYKGGSWAEVGLLGKARSSFFMIIDNDNTIISIMLVVIRHAS